MTLPRLALAAVLIAAPAAANATMVTYVFEGEIDRAPDAPLDTRFAVSDAFRAEVSFDVAAPNTSGSPTVFGRYLGGPLVVTVGDYVAQSAATFLDVRDDFTGAGGADQLVFFDTLDRTGDPVAGFDLQGLGIGLTAPDDAAFDGVDLPLSIDPADYRSLRLSLVFRDLDAEVFLQARLLGAVTDVTVSTPGAAVPAPAPAALLGAAVFALGVLRRRLWRGGGRRRATPRAGVRAALA